MQPFSARHFPSQLPQELSAQPALLSELQQDVPLGLTDLLGALNPALVLWPSAPPPGRVRPPRQGGSLTPVEQPPQSTEAAVLKLSGAQEKLPGCFPFRRSAKRAQAQQPLPLSTEPNLWQAPQENHSPLYPPKVTGTFLPSSAPCSLGNCTHFQYLICLEPK